MLIIADDVTGAADALIPFRAAGWPSYLVFADIPEVARQARRTAISVSTGSRPLSDAQASVATYQAINRYMESVSDRLYLKVDSTMRGSVAGQIDGALKALARRQQDSDPTIVLCPAYPRMGRTVRAGRVYVRGSRLDRTEAGVDPITPVRSARMTDLVPSAVDIERGTDARDLARRLLETAPNGGVLSVDAVDEQDLRRIATAANLAHPGVVCAGSAGLARHLARAWALPPGLRARPVGPPGRDGRVIVCVSSLSSVARSQARHLVETLGLGVVTCDVPHCDPLDPVAALDYAPAAHRRRARVLLVQPAAPQSEPGRPAESSDTVAYALARYIGTILDETRVSSLVLVGGDGASAILHHLGTHALEMQYPLADGIPLTRVIGGAADGLTAVTKAGSFGPKSAITDAVHALLHLSGGLS